MPEISRIYLCGLGALGGVYGSLLQAGKPGSVRVIASRERSARYSRPEITVNGKPFPFTFIAPDQPGPPADLILIAVKHQQLPQAIADIRNFVGEHTIILSLLNGIESEEAVGQVCGRDKLLLSFVVGTDPFREGLNVRYSFLGWLVFGENRNPTHSPRVAALKQLFDLCQIPNRVPEDMVRELWWKFMLNVGVNQLSAVLRAGYGQFLISPAREALREACLEVVRIAEKAGVNLTEADIDKFYTIFEKLDPQGRTSMLQDVEAQRPTEVDIFAGTVIKLGRQYGVPTPINKDLYQKIRQIERAYAK